MLFCRTETQKSSHRFPESQFHASRKLIVCLLFLCSTPLAWLPQSAVGQEAAGKEAVASATNPVPATIPATIELEDGDTFVFLGDSITHQRLYTQYVEDYFYTRFPHKRIRFHNAGIGGARAWDALQRIDRDVLSYHPKYVSILLGMNDGSYQPFDPAIFSTYQTDMLEVIRQLKDGGTVPVVMAPTMFDARAAKDRNRWQPEMLAQYNSVLAYYGKWLQHEAIENGFSYVDMFTRLNRITVEQRKKDAGFTLIKDAIHPDAPGQLVMAFAMIEDLHLANPLSSIRLNRNPAGVLKATVQGGKLENLKESDGVIEFDWTADGLPWVVPPAAELGVKLTNLGHRASREALEVQGLAAGNWSISIDGTEIGKWNHAALARHIELQNNSKTPQYQQALEVALLNQQKNEGPVKELRDSWGAFQAWARQNKQLAAEPENTRLAEQLAASKARVDRLDEVIATTAAKIKEFEDQIYATNQPKTRHYVIRIAK